jgi:hypothetical protein
MRRHLALLFAVALALTAPEAGAESPFEQPEISVVTQDGHAEVTVTLKPVEGAQHPTGKVPFTAEPYSIVVSPTSGTVEYDLFGSGLAMDLDGNGETSDMISVECFAGGVLHLGGTPVRPFVDELVPGSWRGNYHNPDGTERVARIGAKGAYVALYTPCRPERPTSLGLAPARTKMPVVEVPGPALQLLVLEEVFVPSKQPTVTISKLAMDGRPVRKPFAAVSHAYEPVFDQRPLWHGVVWRMISLGETSKPHSITAQLSAKGEPRRRMIVAILNTSPTPGVRERAVFASAPVKL